jgi:hypothetical protein
LFPSLWLGLVALALLLSAAPSQRLLADDPAPANGTGDTAPGGNQDGDVPKGQPSRPQAPKIDLQGRSVEDRAPLRSFQENPFEAKAYCDALVTAHYTSSEAFANSARRDVTFAHLFEQPHVYRGQVVHMEGRLKRLRHFEAPRFTWSQDVRDLYEGWIFDPKVYGANPTCVVFTDLPQGLKIGEEIQERVSFDGYFFKRYRYQAGDGWRDSPLLIGHTVVVPGPVNPASEDRGADSQGFIASLLALLSHPAVLLFSVFGLTAVLVVGLTWWYKRGDRQVRSRLAVTQVREFVEPGSQELARFSDQQPRESSLPRPDTMPGG